LTPPLYLVPAGGLDGLGAGAVFLLDGVEGRHAVTVRRARPGERIAVADGAGRVVRGVVDAVARDQVSLRVEAVSQEQPAWPRLVLVQALAKGGRDELAAETATELGVDVVVPWQASRCVVIWSGERGEKSRRRWEDTVRAAAKQSRRTYLPPVEPAVTTQALVSRVAAVASAGGLVLVLHEDAAQPLATLPLPLPLATLPVPVPVAGEGGEGDGDGDLFVVVGPEGGITDAELAQLSGVGACLVRLGPQVLRSSSAGAAALAVLSLRLGRWG
jgi:16S rRNA (uracil1498-N3)-methyltransferase